MSSTEVEAASMQAWVQVLEDRSAEQATIAFGRSAEQTEDEHMLTSDRQEQVAVV